MSGDRFPPDPHPAPPGRLHRRAGVARAAGGGGQCGGLAPGVVSGPIPQPPRRPAALAASLCALLLLGACAETTAIMAGSKMMQDRSTSQGQYKVGDPYQINGKWYTPREDYGYAEEGPASWYGPGFHGKRTANGDVFDMNDMTAAHPTLPMPSFVTVTNLENGREVVVKINDRGPFASDRIIDVSRAAARALGFEQQGKAMVRVEIMPRESQIAKAQAMAGQQVAALPQPVASGSGGSGASTRPLRRTVGESASGGWAGAGEDRVRRRPPRSRTLEPAGGSGGRPAGGVPARQVDSTATTGPFSSGGVGLRGQTAYVQVGAFADISNAHSLKDRLSPLGPTLIMPATLGDHVLYRVRLGPFHSANQALGTLQRVQGAGYPEARLVGD